MSDSPPIPRVLMPTSLSRREFLSLTSAAAAHFTLVPAIGSPCQRPSNSSPPQDLVPYLQTQIPLWLREHNVPGLGFCLVQNAQIHWSSGFGIGNRASNEAVTPATMFEAASMSKPGFAYVVMKLCEVGMLDLDTPLTRYTSTRFLAGDPRLDLITPRHILAHTSGFQNWRSEDEPLSIHFQPGTKFLYSGEGYNYLQTVVTGQLGQSFEAYMRSRLLIPFEMRSSGYVWNDELAPHMARPHDATGSPMANKKSTSADVARYGAAGALLTTPSDYAKFLIGMIAPRAADAFHLKQESIDEMLRPHVTIEGGQYPASWSLGWQIFHNQDRDFLYHGGDNDGFHCAAVASVAGQSGFVAMTNGENGTAVLRRILVDEQVQEFLAT